MRGEFGFGRHMRAGGPRLPGEADGEPDVRGGSGDQLQARLAAADQLKIDFGQQLGVEQRAMLGPCRVVDSEAPAQRIETGLRAGEFAPGEFERVDGNAGRQWGTRGAAQLGIEEAKIEALRCE